MDCVRCPALQAGMALKRVVGRDAGRLRWSWRCRGAVTPLPGSSGSEGDGGRGAEPDPLRHSPREYLSRYQGEGFHVGGGGRRVRGSASSSALESSSLACVALVSPVLRIEGVPGDGLIRVLERHFDHFLAILHFPGRWSQNGGIGA